MTRKIKLLPEKIVNKIAAGEVVERPASIVKELIENSIDAKADTIKVEIKDGGKKSIKVIDNGEGMPKEDLLMAFERYATSKIKDVNDLMKIQTLGFRGEALPSIASVSKIKARSKIPKDEIGFEINIEGGSIKNVNEVAANNGFTIEVKDLFYNVPVRRKFLKKTSTESFYIENVIKKAAICYPLFDITFINNGRTKTFPKANNLLKRIEQIYSKEIADSLLPFRIEDEEVFISGYISTPDITSSNSYDINIFLNGRFVKDRTVYAAIRDAYKGKIFEKRYPYIFIFMNIPFDKVDVNVHPAKLEVRFHNENKIYTLVKNTLSTVLSNDFKPFNKKIIEKAPDKFNNFKNFIKSSIEKYKIKDNNKEENIEDFFVFESSVKDSSFQNQQNKFYSCLDFLSQIHDTFLILKDRNSLYLLDQHAAHERIQLEKLKKNINEKKDKIKKFLIPEILNLSDEHKVLLEQYIETLNNLGFIFDKLDDKTFVLKGLPVILAHIEVNDLIEIIIEELKKRKSSDAVNEFNEKVLASIACKSAIKAGNILDEKTVKYLLQELDEIPNNKTCPHGRPILIEISKNEILKRFKRIV